MFAACGRVGFDDRIDGGGGSESTVCAPQSMHDEDADGVVDSCDVCPHIAGAQTDSDGDGVGDACDVDPEGALESRVPEIARGGSKMCVYWSRAVAETKAEGMYVYNIVSPIHVLHIVLPSTHHQRSTDQRTEVTRNLRSATPPSYETYRDVFMPTIRSTTACNNRH